MDTNISNNPAYDFMMPHVLKVRDAVRGSVFVKAKRNIYLPHPSSVDTTSPDQIQRYNKYLAGASFDDITAYTERALIGKAKLDDIKFEPPKGLEYLEQDVDKDGLSMKGLLGSCFTDVLEVKWRLLLCDYKGMSELDTGETEYSAQDIADANPRPTIKQYPRESVVDWDFARINGVMQLTYLVLRETACELDHNTGARNNINSYLKLGLDEVGYYQQKKTDSKDGDSSYGEKNYLTVNNIALDFIPVSIACDEEIKDGELPQKLGFLAPIAEKAYERYVITADYSEALATIKATLHVTGVSLSGWDYFKEINGVNYVKSGPGEVNIWTDPETKITLLEPQSGLLQYGDKLALNTKEAKEAGASFKADSSVQRTATEILEEASNSAALLMPIADNVESAVKWQIAYCAMFEGLVDRANLSDYVNEIDLTLARDFAATKLTTEEVKVLIEAYNAGLLPKDEFLKAFELGGWSVSSAEELLNNLETGF